MTFSKDPDLAMCEMQKRIDDLERALEHLRDLAQVNRWERDQAHIDAPCGDEPQPPSIFDEIAGTSKVKIRDIPFKFMTMYVSKENLK
jgi:hypothetical protein